LDEVQSLNSSQDKAVVCNWPDGEIDKKVGRSDESKEDGQLLHSLEVTGDHTLDGLLDQDADWLDLDHA